MKITCPCCLADTDVRNLFTNLPQSSAILAHSFEDASNNAEFLASICNNCKHITNISISKFDADYSDNRYILKTAVTGTMSANLAGILDFVVQDRTSVNDLSVLEIGSGAGEVAMWFAKRGARVTTIDPAIVGYDQPLIMHHQVNFDDAIVQYLDKKFDIVLCRHILEHTNDPENFLKNCTELLTADGKLYIEVPNLAHTLTATRLVDFFNDHIQHFTENSLQLLACKQNLISERINYWLGGAHLGIIFSANVDVDYTSAPAQLDINILLDHSEEVLAKIKQCMNSASSIAIYGAGAHSTTFVSQLSLDDKSKITRIFDRSASKHGRYLPGISVPISDPTIESLIGQDLIINTSVLYAAEVEKFLTSSLKWTGTVLHL